MELAPADSFADIPLLQYHRHRRHNAATCLDHCCTLLLAAVYGAVIVFGVISLPMIILCLVAEPQLAPVRVESATVTTSLNATTAAAAFELTLVFRNPNRIFAVSYRDLEAKVWFGNDNLTLAWTRLEPFSQGAGNETRVRAELAAVNVDGDVAVADEIGGCVKLGVSVWGSIGFSYDRMQRSVIPVRVECEPVIMEFQSGNDTGTWFGPSNCSLL